VSADSENYRKAKRLVGRAHHFTYGDGGDAVAGGALATEALVHAVLALVDATSQPQTVAIEAEKDTLTGESTPEPEAASGRDEYIAGLREFADWLEQRPQVKAPTHERMLLPLTTNAAVEEFAAAHGLAVVVDSNGNTEAELHFGPIVYVAYGYADFNAFCERHAEKQARGWADQNGMALLPRDGGEA
jgi:hypothetical protein